MADEFDTGLAAPVAIELEHESSGQRSIGDADGMRALMCAIMADAVRCIVDGREWRHQRSRAVAAEAADWMRSDDRTSPFSFLNLCDVLAIEPDAVRARVLPVEDGGLPPHQRPRSTAA
jgi:hypothetical protein